jgi:hypothetical protein
MMYYLIMRQHAFRLTVGVGHSATTCRPTAAQQKYVDGATYKPTYTLAWIGVMLPCAIERRFTVSSDIPISICRWFRHCPV